MSDQLIKATLHFKRADGSRYIRVTEDAEAAERWNQMSISVAVFAQVHHANPNWEDVNWETTEIARPSAELPTIEEMSGSIHFGEVDYNDL